MFSHTLYFWWYGTQKIFEKMEDYNINLGGWLEDVTLFPNEPNDYSLNFDLLSNGKTNDEVGLDTGLSDLQWLDEKVDLSVFDFKGFLLPPNESETLILEDATGLLLGLIDSNLDTSCLSLDVSENDLSDVFEEGTPQDQYQVASPASSDFPLATACYESISETVSPTSFVSDVSTDQTYDQYCPSPGGSVSSCVSDLPVSVTVCNIPPGSDLANVENVLSIDDVADSMKNRKFVSDGKQIPKIILKNVFHPYSRSTKTRRQGDKNERKKVQNKEAAARYRIKKRVEEKEISGEVACLKADQEKLQKQHDGLQAEIKYLKSLMREMFEKKGLL